MPAKSKKPNTYRPFFERVKEITMKKEKYPAFNTNFLQVSKEPSRMKMLHDHRTRGVKFDMAREMNILVGDRVQVLHGQDTGKQGVIRHLLRNKNQCIVTDMNMKKTFWSKNATGPSLTTVEMPMHITNVALLDPVIKKPTRVKRRYTMNGECVRISKLSGSAMPEPCVVTDHPRDKAWRLRKTSFVPKPFRGPLKDEVRDKTHWNMLQSLAVDGLAANREILKVKEKL